MPLTLVQRVSNQSAASVASLAGTYSPAPTQGNLLVCNANSDATLTMTSSGWLLATSSVHDTGLYQWWKIAGASESATVTLTPSASDSVEMTIEEWSGNAATPLDKTASSSAASAVAVIPTGTTAATVQADERAIAAFGWNLGNSTGSYTSSYTEVAQITGLGTVLTKLAVTEVDLAAAAVTSSTATLSPNVTAVKGGLVGTYMVGAAAAGPTFIPSRMPLGV